MKEIISFLRLGYCASVRFVLLPDDLSQADSQADLSYIEIPWFKVGREFVTSSDKYVINLCRSVYIGNLYSEASYCCSWMLRLICVRLTDSVWLFPILSGMKSTTSLP